MSLSVQELLGRIDELTRQVDALEAEAATADGLDREEAALLKRLRRRLAKAQDRLKAAAKRQEARGVAANEMAVKDIDFGDDEGEDVVGEIVDDELFISKRLAVQTSINNWRTNCKTEIETLVSGMMDAEDDDQLLSRDLLLGWAGKALTLLGMPYAKKAIAVTNKLFELSEKMFESTLPHKPGLRETQVSWNKALDAMSQKAIEDAFDGLVLAFKEEHGIPPEEERVLGSNYRSWIAYTESFAEGKLLPKASTLKRDFLTLAYRSMPGDRREEMDHIGTVEIVLDYDEDRGTFSFDTGRIDDLTPEVRDGLKLQGTDLYGNLALDLPAMMDFRIDDGGWSNPQLCHIRRNSIKSGSKDFYLFQRTGSKMSFREQGQVFRAFMRAKAYNVALTKVL